MVLRGIEPRSHPRQGRVLAVGLQDHNILLPENV